MMGYSFYYPPENKVYAARNVKFLDNSLIAQEASGSLKDLEIIQEDDTYPSVDTSLYHEEDDQEIDEPQIHTYKAHLVANGFTQTPRIDYEVTFSPVEDIIAIRILIAIAAFYD
nr:retrovirus-related Pol polyprotein from transposon TNT 1-94 [Tanacetum cinerariifolium]